ncbi:MAG TPA: DUF6458 family protein [Gaiellaceae bacterium]|nr:DUF6458 family protein [Gaiellaceae bacterium]
MGVATSLVVVAIGAILAFAVDVTTNGVDLHVVGWILIAVGLAGLVISIALWESVLGPMRPGPPPRRRRTPPDDAPTRRF